MSEFLATLCVVPTTTKPRRALVFTLDELPDYLPRPRAHRISKRIQRRPFYFTNLCENDFDLPPEPDLPLKETDNGLSYLMKVYR